VLSRLEQSISKSALLSRGQRVKMENKVVPEGWVGLMIDQRDHPGRSYCGDWGQDDRFECSISCVETQSTAL
jgi:hypothetical protein